MILSRIFGGTATRPVRRPSPRRDLGIEPLEGRQLQSGLVSAAPTTPAIVVGENPTPDCGIIKCGGHLGG